MKTNKLERIHLSLDFSEKRIDIHKRVCIQCGAQTMLIAPSLHWTVDENPFGNDDDFNAADIPDVVEIEEEITAHWCSGCKIITSLSFNRF